MRKGFGGFLVALVAIAAVMSAVFSLLSSSTSSLCSPSVTGSIKATGLSAAQLKVARTIVGVAKSRGLPERDAKVSLMVAYQECRLLNCAFGDRDSLGTFQQRRGWGTAKQRLNPVYASNKFFDALEKVKNRPSKTLLAIALEVQRPSYAAYTSPKNSFAAPAREKMADQLLASYTSSSTNTSTASDNCDSGATRGDVQALIAKARQYAWVKGENWQAGGSKQKGVYHDAVLLAMRKGWHVGGSVVPGDDCAGFINILMRTSGYEPNWPNVTTADLADAIARLPGWKQVGTQTGRRFSIGGLHPGDVLVTPNKGHVLLYIGKVSWTNYLFVEAADGSNRAPYTMGTPPGYWPRGYNVYRKVGTASA